MAQSKREQIKKLERQMAQLQARKKALVQQESKQNRKRRNHALMTAGGLVEACFDDGWVEIDFKKLSRYIREHSAEIAGSCTTDALPEDEADRRLRDWERKVRENRARQKEAAFDDEAAI